MLSLLHWAVLLLRCSCSLLVPCVVACSLRCDEAVAAAPLLLAFFLALVLSDISASDLMVCIVIHNTYVSHNLLSLPLFLLANSLNWKGHMSFFLHMVVFKVSANSLILFPSRGGVCVTSLEHGWTFGTSSMNRIWQK